MDTYPLPLQRTFYMINNYLMAGVYGGFSVSLKKITNNHPENEIHDIITKCEINDQYPKQVGRQGAPRVKRKMKIKQGKTYK